jgi:hypothetical protein
VADRAGRRGLGRLGDLDARLPPGRPRRARFAAIVKAAAGARDPRLGALLLLEAARDGEPPGGLEVARRLASEPIPLRVLEGHEGPVTSVAVSPDGVARS